MAHVFRYPLTRFCLKSGTLTLPRTMVGLFPDSGEVLMVDTITDQEFSVTAENARTVAGFSPLFKRHQLAVNDELVIEPLADSRFAVTATAHQVTVEDSTAPLVRRVLDEVYEAEVPVTEAEVRALYPTLPATADVLSAIEADGRFTLRHGRWHNAAALAAETDATPVGSTAAEPAHLQDQEDTAVDAVLSSTTAPSRVGAGPGAISQQLGATSSDTVPPMQSVLWGGAATTTGHGAENRVPPSPGRGGDDSREAGPRGGAPWSVFERRTPTVDGGPFRTPAYEAGAEDDDDGASLEVTELANRLRAALVPLGFRLEALGRGQLDVHADMGRRGYRVLVQLLSRTQRLDWADLLARRRTSGVKYVAVVGDHRDLLPLTNPADLARATLWSWQALDRMSLLHRSVPLSPIELEAHFERDGLFEQGLQRLEATIAQRVAERGAMSEVLARLAVMRSPSVFLLEELAGELGMSRELVLRILERLADTPFHLVAKVDAGEFVLRQTVSDSLGTVGDYASSLRARLPIKQIERLVASGEPDLLTDADDIDRPFGPDGAEA